VCIFFGHHICVYTPSSKIRTLISTTWQGEDEVGQRLHLANGIRQSITDINVFQTALILLLGNIDASPDPSDGEVTPSTSTSARSPLVEQSTAPMPQTHRTHALRVTRSTLKSQKTTSRSCQEPVLRPAGRATRYSSSVRTRRSLKEPLSPLPTDQHLDSPNSAPAKKAYSTCASIDVLFLIILKKKFK
jgi:hypothetical protein